MASAGAQRARSSVAHGRATHAWRSCGVAPGDATSGPCRRLQGLEPKELSMPAPQSLKDVYTDEIKDLWSANDQMIRAVTTLTEKAHDPALKTFLDGSVAGIGRHNGTLKSLLEDSGEAAEKEHCKGMEGLVKEALKHGVKEAPEDGELRDIIIIAQYQRMSHYGITGFGSAAAYAKALGMKQHETQLKSMVADIYKADETGSQLGEKAAKLAARHSKASAAG
jgi:ferritin-like metal-binding protein YciE